MTATPLDGGALRRRLANGETTVGTFVGMASATATEVCAAAGADWVLIDLEHGAGSEDVIRDSVLAAGSYGVPVVVRVESSERIRIGRVLDQGAAGVMVPRLDKPGEVAAVLTHLQYPPHGDRGALDAVDEIAAQDGVDVLFVGPLDLSFALGVPLQFDSPEFLAATGRVLDAAAAHHKTAGILAANAAMATGYVERGFRFVTIGSDTAMLVGVRGDAFAAIRNTHI